jgi:hypothetical protein
MTEKNLTDFVSWAMNLGAAPFTVLAVIAVGYVLRLVPAFPNKWLPATCVVVGTIIFPVLAHHHADDTEANYLVRTIFMGMIIGFGAWAFHNKILKSVEDKIPLLGTLLSATQEKAQTDQNEKKL